MSGSFSGAKAPDYSVTAFDKVTKLKNKIGAAWIQPDGSLRIKFDAFISLPTYDDSLFGADLSDLPVVSLDDDGIPF